MDKKNYLIPLLLSVFLALGMILGSNFGPGFSVGSSSSKPYQKKFEQVLGYIENAYVDTPDKELLVESAIQEMLVELDPYSSYISAKDLAHANEQLDGNFEGIGVEFNILNDTVTVVNVITGGPSERLGILPGDKFISVEGESIAGVGMENNDVIRRLKGPKNTKVKVEIKRRRINEPLEFEITRDQIKIKSVIAAFMSNSTTGYIKVLRFAGNTADDFSKEIADLMEQGAENMIVDLRGNPGGYLGTAIDMVDEFLDADEMITYTQGRERSRTEHRSTSKGGFKMGKLCVLIDQNSASASEIFAGAIQDLDRGLIVGNRSHGKGLVQEPIELRDGSQLRLTVARYYTPSGRCIQRPYDMEIDINGDVDRADFETKSGRTVTDGGGVQPDIVLEDDTAMYPAVYETFLRKGVIYEYALDYHDAQRKKLLSTYPEQKEFISSYSTPESAIDSMLVSAALADKLGGDAKETRAHISGHFKALMGRYLYGDEVYYMIAKDSDPVYLEAVKAIETDQFALYGI